MNRGRQFIEIALLAMLFAGGLLLAFQFTRISGTIASVHEELLSNGADRTRTILDDFFDPVELSLTLARDRGAAGLFDPLDERTFHTVFFPVIRRNASVSSLLLADSLGNEHMLLQTGPGRFLGRTTTAGPGGLSSLRSEWYVDGYHLRLRQAWPDPDPYDPRVRPWFKGAFTVPEDSVYWTAPYRFRTTREMGITASMYWSGADGPPHVVAYDVLLKDLAHHLGKARPSARGKVFLLSEDELLVGLTEAGVSTERDEGKGGLPPGSDLELAALLEARERWERMADHNGTFELDWQGSPATGRIVPYRLGGRTLLLGMIVPQGDVLAKVREGRTMLALGGGLWGLFAAVTVLTLRHNRRSKHVLEERNDMLLKRTSELNESLAYAKYLQDATLPSMALLKSWLSESFVIHVPKEAVGGDLYWLEPYKERVLFAVLDATGHGIPGALVSMACTNALDRSVRELGFVRPADIIETARQFVVETFMRSASTMQDGMDCCLCSLSYLPVGGAEAAEHIAELAYAGANRPLLLLRQGATQVDVLRTDRQPVGGNVAPTPFTEQRIALAEGDTVYLFTDGITDQFGGNGDRKFGLGALKELLLRVRGMSMEEQRTAIAQALAEWRTGREQVDDMCMLGVRISRLDQLILAPNSPVG